MEKKPGIITSYFNLKYKAEGETESDGKTKVLFSQKQAPLTQHQQEPSASVSSPTLNKKSAEPHVKHSFKWKWKTEFSLTCDKAGAIEKVLRRSHEFKRIQVLNKELVLIKDRKAISSHFPCCLIKDDHLTVTFIKAVDKDKKASGSYSRKRKSLSNKLVTFHVLTKGGENIQRVMKNPWLAKNVDGVTVYAYEGEKMKHALQRDGRFMSTVFSKTCALSEISAETTVEMTDLVDHHDGKTYQIVQLGKSAPLSRQDIGLMKNEPGVSLSYGNQVSAQRSTSTKLGKVGKPKPGGNMVPRSGWYEIPNSKKLRVKLTLIFKKAVKGKKSLSNIQNLFHAEFGKNSHSCNEVKTMKQMTERSHSVCFIQTPRLKGTGFLLFDKFVLTSGHVLNGIYNKSTGKLNEKVTAHFSYESSGELGPPVEVKSDVVGYEMDTGGSGQTYDWALLELSEGQRLPSGLLQHFGFPSQRGGICIIGHPECKVKRMDACFIVSPDNRDQVMKKHSITNPGTVQIEESDYGVNPGPYMILTDQFFVNVESNAKDNQVLTYGSCFYHGSSGSPVFDEYCNVVAMHSGGFVYKNKAGQSNSLIEYGHPLSIIIQRHFIQIAIRQKFDVLKKYIASCNERHNDLREDLKKMVASRHLTEFQAALRHPEVQNDKTLKSFFEYFSQKEEHVPVGIHYAHSS